jgi:hypothetical protein
MITALLSSFLCIWFIWAIIYLAHRYCPIFPRGESDIVRDLIDSVVRHGIFTNEDFPTFADTPLRISLLRALDFLYYTAVLALITFDIFYIWSG